MALLCFTGFCKAQDGGPVASEAPAAPLYGLQGSVASNRSVQESAQARAVARARELNALKEAMAAQANAGRPVAHTAEQFISLNPPPPAPPRPADGSPRSTPSVPLASPGVPRFDLSGGAPAGGGPFGVPVQAAAPSFELPSSGEGERRGFLSRFGRNRGASELLAPVAASSYEMSSIASLEGGPSDPEPPAAPAAPAAPVAGEGGAARVEAPALSGLDSVDSAPASAPAPAPIPASAPEGGVAPVAGEGAAPVEAGREPGGLLGRLRARERGSDSSAFPLGLGAMGGLAGRQAADAPGEAPIFVNRAPSDTAQGERRALSSETRIETGGVLVRLHPGEVVLVLEETEGDRVRVQLGDGRTGEIERATLAP